MTRTMQLLAGIALLGGCGSDRIVTDPAGNGSISAAAQSRASAEEQRDLATLRQVTAPFHNFDKAMAAGWSAQITPCMTDPGGAGGMGFHFGNTKLIDGAVQVDSPELLLYEPGSNGQQRLVAVEYIVPIPEWKSAQPPRLFGRDFHVIDAFQVWALHVWAWKDNPSGMFMDWNPDVNCANTTDVAAMAHN